MPLPLKILLGLFGALLLLLVSAAIALPLLFDPNDYRDEIAQQVEDKTGREFTMAGDLKLSVFPWLGIETNQVSLANAKGFGPEPFAEIRQLSVRLRLLPLLKRQIEIGTVVLDGLRLRLEQTASRNNWADLNQAGTEDDNEPAQQTTEQAGDSNFSIDALSVGAIEITDEELRWIDAKSGQDLTLQNFNLRTGRVEIGKPLNLSGDFDVAVGKPKVVAEVDLLGIFQADLDQQGYKIDGLQIDVLAEGETLPGGKQKLSLSSDLRADLEAGTFNVANLVAQAAGLNVKGAIDGSGLDTGKPAYTGTLSVPEFSPKAVFKALDIAPPQTREAALDSAKLDARITGTANAIKLKDITAKLDSSTLQGTASIDGFAQPAIAFDLALDTLNLDRYLPPSETASDETESDKTGGGNINDTEIPVDALQGLDVDGKLSVASFQASNLKFEDARITIVGKPGQPLKQTLTAKGYGGNIQIENSVAASGTPRYTASGNLDQVLAGALLSDLMDTNWLAGTGLVKYNLRTQGKTVGEMRSNLGGTLAFNLANGAIKGIDLGAMLRTAQTQLNGGAANADSGGETRFNAFGGTVNINKGTLSNNDLKAGNEDLGLAGGGSVNLVSMTMDYVLKPTLKRAPEGSNLQRLVGIPVPVKLSGPVNAPKVSLDLKSVLRQQADAKIDEEKARLESKVDEEKERAKDKLRDKAGEALRGLFGGQRQQPPADDGKQQDQKDGAEGG